MNDYDLATLCAEWCDVPAAPIFDASGRFLAPPQPWCGLRADGPHEHNCDARTPVRE